MDNNLICIFLSIKFLSIQFCFQFSWLRKYRKLICGSFSLEQTADTCEDYDSVKFPIFANNLKFIQFLLIPNTCEDYNSSKNYKCLPKKLHYSVQFKGLTWFLLIPYLWRLWLCKNPNFCQTMLIHHPDHPDNPDWPWTLFKIVMSGQFRILAMFIK